MSDQLSRSPRTVTVADHLWDTYALMSVEMGVDRDGLVNQALFAFARSHGYLTPGSTRASMPPPAASVPPPVATPASVSTPAPVAAAPVAAVAPAAVSTPPPVAAPVAFTPASVPAVSAAFESLPSIPPVPTPAAVPSVPEFTPSPLAAAASVPDDATPPSGASPTPLSTAAVSEPDPDPKATAAIRVRSTPTPAEPFTPAPAPVAAPSVPAMTPEEVRAAQERVLQKAAEFERQMRGEDSLPPPHHEEPLPAELPVEHDEGTPARTAAPEPTLVIYAEGREVDRVTSARFLIGRGKHCDLIINSGKVSREHAAIMREGDAFYIEDLGSSNGTWFDKKRITRRRVEDGDEYFVCSEKLSCRVTY